MSFALCARDQSRCRGVRRRRSSRVRTKEAKRKKQYTRGGAVEGDDALPQCTWVVVVDCLISPPAHLPSTHQDSPKTPPKAERAQPLAASETQADPGRPELLIRGRGVSLPNGGGDEGAFLFLTGPGGVPHVVSLGGDGDDNRIRQYVAGGRAPCSPGGIHCRSRGPREGGMERGSWRASRTSPILRILFCIAVCPPSPQHVLACTSSSNGPPSGSTLASRRPPADLFARPLPDWGAP